MLWLVLLKIRLALIALAKRLACTRQQNIPSLSRIDSRLTCIDISSWSSRGKLTKWSYLVPIKNGIAVLLNPRPCRYHSLIELSVLFLVRSNMNRIATASLHTSGSMLTNSRCPPRSHIEKVISVFRIEMVFSMKLTPADVSHMHCSTPVYNPPHPKSECNPHPSSLPRISPSNSSSRFAHLQPCQLW